MGSGDSLGKARSPMAMDQLSFTGLVTTHSLNSIVTDSTPGAFGSHTQARTAGTGIIDEFVDDRQATGLIVLPGGGRK